jgi:hypothetical protein
MRLLPHSGGGLIAPSVLLIVEKKFDPLPTLPLSAGGGANMR